MPRLPAIERRRDVVGVAGGIGDVAPKSDAVQRIPERQRCDPRRFSRVEDRYVDRRPGATTVHAAEDPGRAAGTRSDPDKGGTPYDETRPARRESAFALSGNGKQLRRQTTPVRATVGGGEHHGLAIHLVAVDESVIAIPEIHAVVEARGIRV